jgi:hypothetical protein
VCCCELVLNPCGLQHACLEARCFWTPPAGCFRKKKMKCLYIESSGRLEDHKEQAHGLNQKYRSW